MNARFLPIIAALVAAILTAPGPGAVAQEKPMKMMMGGLDMSEVPHIPPVAGYAEGEQIFFLHTEVSDPEIGRIMTEMMDSPGPVVASLAKAPEEMLAIVYAFTKRGAAGPKHPDLQNVPSSSLLPRCPRSGRPRFYDHT